MGDLDEISAAIGELRSGQKRAELDRSDMLRSFDVNASKMLDALAQTNKSVADLRDDLNRTKQRGIMALLGMSAAGGAGGGTILELVTKFFAKG